MKMMRKKSICLCMLCIFMLMISGCAKGDKVSKTADGKKEVAKGRYVESEVAFPDEIKPENVVQLGRDNGKVVLLTKEDNSGKILIRRFVLDEKDTFTEDTPKWFADIQADYEKFTDIAFISGKDGKQYLYIEKLVSEEEGYQGLMFSSSDGTTCKEITPTDWKEINKEWGSYETPYNVNVTSEGILVANYSTKTNFYKSEDGNLLSSIALPITDTIYADNVLAIEDNLYVLLKQGRNDQKPISLDFYEPQKKDIVRSYKITSKLSSYQYLDINDAKDLILCNSDGIHVLKSGTTLWQTVVDGTLTSLAMPSMWSRGMIQGENECYYILYGSEESKAIVMKYVFDPDMPSVPGTELNVFALEESSTLRQAAEIFQKKHPEVRVNVKTTTNAEGESSGVASKDDSIRMLNTELLAKGGPDIIALDGLPVQSFVEQGVLMDLSEILSPMLEKGELFENLVNCYKQEDGKIYEVPVRFSFQVIGSKEEDAAKVSTLNTLAEYLAGQNESIMGQITADDLINKFEPFILSKILEGKKEINQDALISVLEELKKIGDNSGIVNDYGENQGASGLWDLPSKVSLCMQNLNGFKDSMFTLAVVNLVKGSYEAFDQTFIPNCQLGINAASKQKELAQEFLELVLSVDIQKYDFYDGFSVNKEAIKIDSQKDRTSAQAYTSIEMEDGGSIPFTIEVISDKDIAKLIQICESLDVKAKSDDIILEGIKKQMPNFLNGKDSAEQTADKIIENTLTYQQE